jgi:hypothetical protein
LHYSSFRSKLFAKEITESGEMPGMSLAEGLPTVAAVHIVGFSEKSGSVVDLEQTNTRGAVPFYFGCILRIYTLYVDINV